MDDIDAAEEWLDTWTAQAALAGRVATEVRATVGEDTETGRAVIPSFDSRFPAPRGEEDR